MMNLDEMMSLTFEERVAKMREESNRKYEESVNDMRRKHEERVAKMREESNRKYEESVNDMRRKHEESVNDMRRKHEEFAKVIDCEYDKIMKSDNNLTNTNSDDTINHLQIHMDMHNQFMNQVNQENHDRFVFESIHNIMMF